ncbi:MAG: DUF4340 domain-containing protein [Saprospiraceae bacterium]|nr:DUF4340 domain-containing protein [Saprospiraceae bacterium]
MAVLFILLGGGAWYVISVKNAESGSRNSWDMEFAVPNTEDIYKIFIAGRNGQTATLERKEEYWMYNGKYRARPSAVSTLLETIAKINVRYIPPQATEKHMIKSLAAEGIKVEIYDKAGKVMKSYYVGGVTNDELGTYVMMENAERPYVAHIPSFVGQLRVRYLLGDDNWKDRTVFSEKPESIQSITVEYPKMKSESFRLEKVDEASYAVVPYFSTTPRINTPVRKGVPEAYLLQYEQLGAESFETRNPDRDSVMSLVPFAIVTVKKTDSTEKVVRFWPAITLETREGRNYIDRFYADVDRQDFMLVQDRVFGPIFRGYRYFYEGAQRVKN